MKEYRDVAGSTRASVPSFLLGSGAGRQWYALVDSYCEEPDCPGFEACVSLYPDRDPAHPITFHLDLAAGKIATDGKLPATEDAVLMEFARDRRRMRLLTLRRQVVRASGLLRLRSKQDYDPGRTYGFRDFEARRDSFEMPFEPAGHEWVAADQYCTNPECTCDEAHLHFYAYRPERAIQEPEFAAAVNLKTGAIADPDNRALSPDRAAVVQSFFDELGDWHGYLSIRRDLLRRIARIRLRFEAAPPRPAPVVGAPALVVGLPLHASAPSATPISVPPPPAGTLRPGRNEPCPCGSGKKYKKCCGLRT